MKKPPTLETKSERCKTRVDFRRILRRLGAVPATLLLFIVIANSGTAQDVKSLIAEGDKYALKSFDNKKALEVYQKAEALDAKNYNVLWRISRTLVDISEHLPASTDEQKKEQISMYGKSLDYADKAIKVNPGGMMGYLRRAITNGRIALSKGVFSQIGLIKDVKADVEKAIKLHNEDNHELAVAHYVLARSHAKVCEKPYLVRLPLGLGWGDRKTSAEEYEKAIALSPDFVMFRVDAARNYIEMDEYQKAKEHLYKVPQLGIRDEDDQKMKKEAAAMLQEIKNK